MSGGTPAGPQVLHALPGRIRVHLPAWPEGGRLQLEQHVRRLPGVHRVEANPLTANVLIGFDCRATNADTLLAALGTVESAPAESPHAASALPVVRERGPGILRRARIAVRGLDRDPRVGRRVISRLRRLFGVRAQTSPLTGRVLVEYDERRVDLRELLAHVAAVELPDLPGEDRPAHPLDLAPLLHAATRMVGATLGLGLLAVRRLAGLAAPSVRVRAATAAGVIGLLRSFPFVRQGMRRALGRNAADMVFGVASAATLTLSSNALGLLVTGLEGLLLLNAVLARRSGWRRYEESLRGDSTAEPGSVIRLKAGAKVPWPAQVIEGTGTAIGRDGLPRPIAPGTTVSAGADLSGGPFVLHLEGGKPFLPQPRPAPLAPTLHSRYLHVVDPLALGLAALTGVLTRSPLRVFESLLLVNPRTALIGQEAANLDAAARAMRAGVIVVATRPDRAIRLPDVLLLDGPRVLTSGLEVTTVLPLEEDLDDEEVLALTGAVSTAAGSPWGDVFPLVGREGADGLFNGLWAAATVQGSRYLLGPPEDPPAIGEAVGLRHRGGYLLMLSHAEDGRPLGLVALRPVRAAGSPQSRGPGESAGGLEITAVLPLEEGLDDEEVLALAGAVSSSAGSPWGRAFPRSNREAADGAFNGLWATATVQGSRYTLGPPEEMPAIGEAIELRHRGGYLLMLSREEDWRPLGFVTLRPRLAPGAVHLVQTCRRLGVRLEMLSAGAPLAAQAIGRRAEVALVSSPDSVAVIRDRQQAGAFVAFVSDSAHAAPAFADCDLAIGLAPPTGAFPARADLLAHDLRAVAAVLEAGARRDLAVRDAVGFSLLANVFGAYRSFQGGPGLERASQGVYLAALASLADGWLRLLGH
jgi:cation transport ATPase